MQLSVRHGKPTPGAHRDGEKVAAARYPSAREESDAQWSRRSSGPTQSPHPCRCGNREVWDDFRLSRMRRDLDEEHSEGSLCSVQRENHDRDAK